MMKLRLLVLGLTGWRRFMLAALLGAVLALAQAPVYAWPLVFICVPLLLLLSRDAGEGRTYFLTHFAFAYGYFVAGLYWIGIAFFVDAARFALLLPLPVLGLPALLAIFPAAGAWIARRLGGGGEPWRALLFAAGWTLGEALRGFVLTGFPWNLIGYVWADMPAAMQITAFIGSHGLGALTLLVAGALALPLLAPEQLKLRRVALALPLGFALLIGGGAWRLHQAVGEDMPDVWLRLVQPSIPQTLKWVDDLRQQHLRQHAELTRRPGQKPFTHVIWPETAIPFLVDENPELLKALGQLLPPGGQLFAGAPRRAFPEGRLTLYNSLFVINDKGGLDGRYDKLHLVPFGEYLPFRSLLGHIGLDKLAVGSVDFSPGHDGEAMILPGDLPLIRVLICYEAIFPSAVMAHEPPLAAMLLNITNDAWFGRSSGPYQHFASARMRAVEQGVPLVRAANNGLSAIVDPWGRIVASLGLDAVGFVEGPLPAPLLDRTLYSRIGDLPVHFVAAISLLAGLVRRRFRH
jgi:apolipoprotein N-acyltransferase